MLGQARRGGGFGCESGSEWRAENGRVRNTILVSLLSQGLGAAVDGATPAATTLPPLIAP